MGSGGSNSNGSRSGRCSISYCSGSGSHSSSAPGDALEHQHGARDLDLRDEIEQLDHGGVARGGRAQPEVRGGARALGLALRFGALQGQRYGQQGQGWAAGPELRLGLGRGQGKQGEGEG